MRLEKESDLVQCDECGAESDWRYINCPHCGIELPTD